MKISSLISICLASILTFSNLNTKELNWYFVQNGNTVSPPKESASFIDKYDTYYIGDPEKKIIYLTFDEGYENGYTGKILDILKDNNVPAAFFVFAVDSSFPAELFAPSLRGLPPFLPFSREAAAFFSVLARPSSLPAFVKGSGTSVVCHSFITFFCAFLSSVSCRSVS